MKKPQHKKAKFYKGQVVCDSGKLFTKITTRYQMFGGGWYYDLDALFKGKPWRIQVAECHLRPLTAKEKGPRRNRGQ